jgi:hypothetical protein
MEPLIKNCTICPAKHPNTKADESNHSHETEVVLHNDPGFLHRGQGQKFFVNNPPQPLRFEEI